MDGEQNLRERKPPPAQDGDLDVQASPKLPEGEGELFPVGMAVKILTAALVIFTVIPYLGITRPAAPRTDIPWWQSGYLYKVDINDLNKENLKELPSLGVTGLKVENVKTLQPGQEEEAVLASIKEKGLQPIITIGDEVLAGQKNLRSLIQSLSKVWFDLGAAGISVQVTSDMLSGQLHNVTASLRNLADNYVTEEMPFILVMVETPDTEVKESQLDLGANLVSGPLVCGMSTTQLSTNLNKLFEGKIEHARYAWQPCSTSSYRLLPVMLPGTVIFSKSDISFLQKEIHSFLEYKKWPSMLWGKYEQVRMTDSIFSFMRWANGKIYDKFVLIVNLGDSSVTEDLAIRISKFAVPKKGIVRQSFSSKTKLGDIIEMEKVELQRGGSFVVQHPPFGV